MAERYPIGGTTAAGISASVEAAVRDGSLGPGDPLPPVRALADRLGVSPGTVAKAYQALRARGLVVTAGRAGTRVRSSPPVQPRTARTLPVPDGVLDLASGAPDPDLLPPVQAALARVARDGAAAAGYREPGVVPVLRALAVERLTADGVPADAVTVTSGALDAIERLLSAHLRPGDAVGVEDPGWAALLDLVAALGLETVGIPVDDDGPTEAGLRRALARGVGAVVLTARAHNPTGAAITAGRAATLRAALAGADVLLVEDDHAAELSPVPLAPLAGATSSWAFVRSVSKPYGPDLRLAVLTGDESTVARVGGRMRLGAGWVSTVLQRTVAEMWQDPGARRVVADARGVYGARRAALVHALAERGVRAHGRTGINVWVPVRDETAVVTVLRDRGFAVAPGSLFRIGSGPGVRITVSGLDVPQVERLADAVGHALAPGGPFTA